MNHGKKVAIITIGLVLLCFSVSTFGQPPLTISLSPMLSMLQLSPGQSYDGSFQVTNEDEEPVSVTVSLNDFMLTEEGTVTTLEPGATGDRSLASYIDFSPDTITLDPGESQEVRYSFTLPTDVTGPHWAVLVVTPEASAEELPQSEEEDIAFRVLWLVRYVHGIIQRPTNPSKPEGRMIAMHTDTSNTEEGDTNLTIRASFENTGESILMCQTYIEIRDQMGEIVLRYDFPKDTMVLPEAKRIFSYTLDSSDLDPGQYLILCVVDFGGDQLVGGQYMATVGESP